MGLNLTGFSDFFRLSSEINGLGGRFSLAKSMSGMYISSDFVPSQFIISLLSGNKDEILSLSISHWSGLVKFFHGQL